MKAAEIRALRALGRKIIEEEAARMHWPVEVLVPGRDRKRQIANARHGAMYRIAAETALPVDQIAAIFHVNTSSVRNGISSHAKRNKLPHPRIPNGPGRPGIPIGPQQRASP